MEQDKVEVKIPKISDGAESTLKFIAIRKLMCGIGLGLYFFFGIENHAIGIGGGIGVIVASLVTWAALNVFAYISLRLKVIQETMSLKLVDVNTDDGVKRTMNVEKQSKKLWNIITNSEIL